jgi:hypothetical protein
MNDLLETVIEAHGGRDRWKQFDRVSARLNQGGALWALKGQPGVLDDVVVTASLHHGRGAVRPAVLGSVSHFVLNHGTVPTLLVHDNGEWSPPADRTRSARGEEVAER